MLLTSELAEFTGALLGDGCLSKYFVKSENRERYELAFTGSVDDFSYYNETLQPIICNAFGVKGRLFFRGNSTRFHIKSKKVFNFFAGLGFMVGKKGQTLSIPEVFLERDELALAVVRGLWNTDGSIYRRYNKMYPGHARLYNKALVMQLKMNSNKLLLQVKEILAVAGIKTSSITKEKKAFSLHIGSQDAIKKYLKLIGFSNKHHLKRISKFNAFS
ncbi:MAG: hypothetical protein JW744_03000 [Candidatus Diapherotrites archaeon]|uniref:DOD-type homing endonuclease domain-containing protein n=1 Tax=Candidatus Iainarchaeum sp. TaxID=3101447 RepID=A0A938YUJ7_9ARCH|nr:hypothetical protein [Candidatus Diapherotrites archaeon]